MSNNQPFVHKEYLPVADNTVVTGDASAITQAGKLVALDSTGKINKYFIPYSDLSVTSLSIDDGEPITGDVRLYGAGTIQITRSGTDFYIAPNFPEGVMSLNVGEASVTGDVILVAGDGIAISSSEIDHTISIRNTGVLALNGLSGNVTVESLGGLAVTTSSGTLTLSMENISWDKFDSTSDAKALRVVVESGIFLGTDTEAALYQDNNQTIIRGTSGVRFYDPVILTEAVVSGGNGLAVGASHIREADGVLHIEPASGSVVFSTGTEILGIQGIQASFESGSYLTLDGDLYVHTFAHGANLLPLSLLVTYVPGYDSLDFTENTQGMGANVASEQGYSVVFDRNSITVQARLDVTDPPYFRVRSLFQAEGSPADLPAVSSVTSAPVKPSVTLLGVPSTGGYPSQILMVSRPVTNATSYVWEVSGTSWTTSTPLLSSAITSGLSFASPGDFTFTVYAVNSASTGTAIDFDVAVRPSQPALSDAVFSVYPHGYYRDVTLRLTYQPPCTIEILNVDTGLPITYVKQDTEDSIGYQQPVSIVGATPAYVNQNITLKNLYIGHAYTISARAIVGELSSDSSESLSFGPLS